MRRPVPSQSLHGAENPKAPRFSEVKPVPLQVPQVEVLPEAEPEPWQVVHGALPLSARGMVVPLAASRKSRVISVSTSAPRDGLAEWPALPPRLKTLPKISPTPPP